MKINLETISAYQTYVGLGMQMRKTAITSDQLLDLFATPVVLVPAPGAGKIIMPFNFLAILTFGTLAYSTHTSSPNVFYEALTTHTLGVFADDMFTQTEDNIAMIGWGGGMYNGAIDPDDLIDQAIVLSSANNLTGGDGSLQIWSFYMILDVAA